MNDRPLGLDLLQFAALVAQLAALGLAVLVAGAIVDRIRSNLTGGT